MNKLVAGLAACLILAGLSPHSVLAASGTALGVDPDAEAHRGDAVRVLVVGDDVAIGERIVTGAGGQVQILFSDGTELVVGPGSSLVIEDYLLRQDGSAGKLAINALAGTFRFVTGTAPKDRYTIRTPTGTIGVRGTAFDLFVTAAWSYVLMHHGSTESCNQASQCIVLEARCEVGQFSDADAEVVGEGSRLSRADRARLRQVFLYADSQRPLLPRFRVDDAEQCLRLPSPAAPAGSLVGQGAPEPPPPADPDDPDDPDDDYFLNEDGCWESVSDPNDVYCF